MKIVYVAHPFTNDPVGNIAKIEKIMKYLTLNYPDICFVSPLHNFSYDKDAKEADILPKCLNLLSQCAELWVFGDYAKSTGCHAEIAYARYLSIPVLFRRNKGLIAWTKNR